MLRLLAGSTVGIVLGVALGLITAKWIAALESIGAAMHFFRFIPPLALIPLFLVWMGTGETAKIAVLAWTTFFPVWLSTHDAILHISRHYGLLTKSLRIKTGFLLKQVLFRGSLASILTSARVGIGITFSVLVAAEMLGAYAGIGYRIALFQSVYQVDRMIAYILVLGILGFLLDKIVALVSARLTRWKQGAGD